MSEEPRRPVTGSTSKQPRARGPYRKPESWAVDSAGCGVRTGARDPRSAYRPGSASRRAASGIGENTAEPVGRRTGARGRDVAPSDRQRCPAAFSAQRGGRSPRPAAGHCLGHEVGIPACRLVQVTGTASGASSAEVRGVEPHGSPVSGGGARCAGWRVLRSWTAVTSAAGIRGARRRR